MDGCRAPDDLRRLSFDQGSFGWAAVGWRRFRCRPGSGIADVRPAGPPRGCDRVRSSGHVANRRRACGRNRDCCGKRHARNGRNGGNRNGARVACGVRTSAFRPHRTGPDGGSRACRPRCCGHRAASGVRIRQARRGCACARSGIGCGGQHRARARRHRAGGQGTHAAQHRRRYRAAARPI